MIRRSFLIRFSGQSRVAQSKAAAIRASCGLAQKYQMTFEDFERQRITVQQGYTWEVESDAIAWETAVDGLRTVQRLLNDLRGVFGLDLPR